ncbi:tRNA(His) guanylyltransferase Thg1 family protein [Nocardia asiatica]|uniref:tRNA(His) guanylyltransferase Thg1 family protein n=1 Tax=Nocardia asiatica TaxID=209252 RepID=UPI002455C550|nr:tRNA(His) guanylyltransferase Thg1 family protein [Nocardia asiatica]
MNQSSLGERIKAYEAASTYKLTPNSCVFIRVDGRAFHTFTRGMKRPFDHALMNTMARAAMETSREMQGFKLGYVQSDEATFMLTDFDTHDTAGWFGYEVNKLVSISASLFTMNFNRFFGSKPTAVFDSRAFVVPRPDAPNVFVWRQRDWERNSLQMLARAHFSHKQLHLKNRAQMHDMLMLEKSVNWATDLNEQEKNGTFILRDGTYLHDRWSYEDVDQYLGSMIESEQNAA